MGSGEGKGRGVGEPLSLAVEWTFETDRVHLAAAPVNL